MAAHEIALSMVGIGKAFGGVTVLSDVTLELRAGQVHALLGENGAGQKLADENPDGRPSAGSRSVYPRRPTRSVSRIQPTHSAIACRWSIRNSASFRRCSVTENIFLGRLPARAGRIDWPRARADAAALLARIGSRVSCEAIVGDLKVADQQEVEIARALSYDPLVFIMDEPSSALSRVEVENLYDLVNVLRKNGIAIVYITHKLDEVFALADRVTILRDGKVAGTFSIGDLDMKTLVECMTGKTVSADTMRDGVDNRSAENVIELQNFAAERMFSAVNFAVAKGSVVGVAGVIGAGKSELARAIVGACLKRRCTRRHRL